MDPKILNIAKVVGAALVACAGSLLASEHAHLLDLPTLLHTTCTYLIALGLPLGLTSSGLQKPADPPEAK